MLCYAMPCCAAPCCASSPCPCSIPPPAPPSALLSPPLAHSQVDDDVYLRLDRLPHAVAQWRAAAADYAGCFKTGGIIKSPNYRWFEPQHALLGGASYFSHAWGSAYVLSGRAAADLAAQRPGSLRQFANEGGWVVEWLWAWIWVVGGWVGGWCCLQVIRLGRLRGVAYW